MKKNVSSIITQLLEYIVLFAPLTGYSIYCYADTLRYTMTAASKGTFWTIIGFCILAGIIYKLFSKKYERYQEEYVVMKADLRNHPDNPTGVKNVAQAKTIIENLDYVIVALPIIITLAVLKAFQFAIDQLIILLEIAVLSLVGKVCLHTLTVALQKKGALDKIEDGGEDK